MLNRFWSRLVAAAVLRRLLAILALVLMIRQSVWSLVLITGNSMRPTLVPGKISGLNKLAYRFRQPARGDIVVVTTGKELITKRIIGLPGEDICVRNGVFYIDGRAVDEVPKQLDYCLRNNSCRPLRHCGRQPRGNFDRSRDQG